MILSGRVIQVSAVILGDALAADHLAGDGVLYLSSVVEFEGVGQVSISDPDDVTYLLPVLSVDDEADTITLVGTLPVDFEEGTEVAAWPVGEEKEAQVVVEDGDDALTARVPHSLFDRMPEGIRDPGAEEAVEVSDSGGDWHITDIYGAVPVVDGSYLDPATVPPTAVNPPVAPAFAVVGMPRGLFVQVTNGQPGWSYTFEITHHTTDSTADITATYPATARPLIYIEAMPDGTPLSAASDGYSFNVTATNEGGSATSAESDVQPLVLNDDGTIASLAVGKLIAGDLIGAFALLGALNVGDNIEITPENGIVVHTPLGDTRLPADGQSPQFTGSATFDALTALGNLKIQGQTNEIAKNSVLELATGTTAPKSAPVPSAYWPSKTVVTPGFSDRGLARHAGSGLYWSTDSLFAGYVNGRAEGGDFTTSTSIDITSDRAEVQSAIGGVAIIGNSMFVLCLASESGYISGRHYVYRYDYAAGVWSYASRFLYEPTVNLGTNSTFDPAIGVRESTGELVIAQCGAGAGYLNLTTYTTAGAYVSRTSPNDADGSNYSGASKGVRAVGFTSADFGSERLFVVFNGETTVRVFNGATQDLVPADSFTMPEAVLGFMWDASTSKFRSITSSKVYDHTAILTTTLSFVQTWRKADATAPDYAQYETDKSPASITVSFPKRAALLLTSNPTPADGTDPNSPDALSFYVASNDTSGGNSTFKRQPPPAAGTVEQRLTVISTAGAAPPTSPNFPASTAAKITSDAADSGGELIQIHGSGAWRHGDISGDAAGRVVGGAFVPIAGAIPFFGGALPTGWLYLNGATFAEATYPLLATALIAAGATFTGVAPTRTVTLPDSRDRFVGGAGTTRPALSTGGSDTMPNHGHYSGTYGTTTPTSAPLNTWVTPNTGTNAVPRAPQVDAHAHNVNGQSGDVVSPNPDIVPKFLAAPYIIRAA